MPSQFAESAVEYRPWGHATHAVNWSLICCPALHFSHAVRSLLGLPAPGRQAAHIPIVDTFPTSHGTHVVFVTSGVFPGGHRVQDTPSQENVPGSQLSQPKE